MKLLLKASFYLFAPFDLYGPWFDMESMCACGRDKKMKRWKSTSQLQVSLMFKLVKISLSPKKKKVSKDIFKMWILKQSTDKAFHF